MTRYYQPDLSTDLDSPFVRDGEDRLIRRSYWLDMDDRTLVMVMVNGIGANLMNDALMTAEVISAAFPTSEMSRYIEKDFKGVSRIFASFGLPFEPANCA